MANDNETRADIVEPCPYCGKGTAVEHVGYDNCFVVRCLHCGYTSGHIASERGAIIRHNKLCREAAAKREMSKNTSKNGADFGQFGNAAAMREALKKARLFVGCCSTRLVIVNMEYIDRDKLCDEIDAALANPPRNCVRFETLKEARIAYADYVSAYIAKAMASNKFDDLPPDFDEWLFELATEQKGETDGR